MSGRRQLLTLIEGCGVCLLALIPTDNLIAQVFLTVQFSVGVVILVSLWKKLEW